MSIINVKNKISKTDKNELEPESFDEHIKHVLTQDNQRVIGYFENNTLVSFLSQVLVNRLCAWHMTMLGTNSPHNWNYKKNGLEYCWANAMDYAEQQGIYRIYWSMPEHWARTQSRTMKTSDVWPRYDIYLEEEVNAGNFPLWDEHKISFGKHLKPHNVVIKQALLKNEHRRFSTTI
jgi:hypothetical protein